MRTFGVSKQRLNRARAHGHTLAKAWNSIPPENFYQVRAKIGSNGYGSLRACRVNPVPDEFPLLLGEMLYQLRSALDACIYQATIYATNQDPPPDENKLEFPITFDASEFPRLAKRRLMHLPQDMQDGIENVQPYNTPSLPPEKLVTNVNRLLGILNDLARKDRHRKLHVVGSWPIRLHPKFTFPIGSKVTLLSIDLMEPGILEDDSELATFHLKNFVTGMNITVNPHLVTNLGSNEPPSACHASDTFDRRLSEIINVVHVIIDQFERYF